MYPFNSQYLHINVMDSTQKEKMTQVADPHNAPDMNPYKTTESFPCTARETTQPGR